MLKSFRYLLLPLAFCYSAVIWVRNLLFDNNILKSSSFNFPVIGVGNLAIGGTGKSPMVEYLVRLLKKDFKPATLSRGYKRKTTGFAIAGENSTALEIGDEPMQFHLKFPDVTVAVGEERLVAIPQILHEQPETEVIILDDAFQHRSVKPGLNILLSEYNNLYTRDFMMPAGDLRDIKGSSKRADIIIVTKCNPALTAKDKQSIVNELRLLPGQEVYFSAIAYGKPYHLFNKKKISILSTMHVLLLCGIANPQQLKSFLTEAVQSYDMLRFPDHHIFHSNDLAEIKKQFAIISEKQKIILTTEKDAVRLIKFEPQLKEMPVYVLPISNHFLFKDEMKFNERITGFVAGFKK